MFFIYLHYKYLLVGEKYQKDRNIIHFVLIYALFKFIEFRDSACDERKLITPYYFIKVPQDIKVHKENFTLMLISNYWK